MNTEYLKTLCRSMYDLQKVRIQMSNRLVLTGKDETTLSNDAKDILIDHGSEVQRAEKNLLKPIKKELKNYIIWTDYLEKVKGCGPTMAGVLISEIKDIRNFATISKLWTYSGYGLSSDGKSKQMKKGEKINWNPYLKTKLRVLAECLLRSNNEHYRKLYDDYRNRIKNRRCRTHIGDKNIDAYGCTPGHRHTKALRYIIKMFLQDLYFEWCRLEGIEFRPTYQEEYLGHVHHAR